MGEAYAAGWGVLPFFGAKRPERKYGTRRSGDGALVLRRSAGSGPSEHAFLDVLHAAAALGLDVAGALIADGAAALTAAPAVPPAPHPSPTLDPPHVTAADDLPERRHP